MTIALIIPGVLFLLAGAESLVRGASGIARRFNVSELVIGLTIVAFGTSSPELIVNIVSALEGRTALAAGNILGSNIFNLLLILGLAALIHPLQVHVNTVRKELPFALLAALMILAASLNFSEGPLLSSITRSEGIFLLGFFAIFLYYSYETAYVEPTLAAPTDVDQSKISAVTVDEPSTEMPFWLSCVLSVLGLVGLGVGGAWIVEGAVALARTFYLSEGLIGLTIVAAGTSLPELATSAVASFRGKSDLAVGNVVGSNIFNTFFILGITACISDIPMHEPQIEDASVNVGAHVLILALLLFGKKWRLNRIHGVLLLAMFAAFLSYLIVRG
ncbi:MAG: calcium/sodium antiporter [Leptospiraceae bacterium]